MRLLLLIILWCLPTVMTALPTRGYRHVTVNEGLSRNSIYSLLQDSTGLVYIGTWDALHCYDGTRVSELMFTPSPRHPVRTVTALAEGAGGKLYVGTSEGVIVRNLKTGEILPFAADTSGFYVDQLLTDDSGRLHMLSDDEVYRVFDTATDSLLGSPQKAQRLALTPGGTVIPLTEGLIPGRKIIAALAGEGGELTVSTVPEGVFHRAAGSERFEPVEFPEAANPRIVSMARYGSAIVMASPRGLREYDPLTGGVTLIEASPSDPHALNDMNITQLMTDREGGLWVGTFFGGINYLSPTGNNFALLDRINPQIDGHVVSAIAEDSSGRLWLGIEDGGLSLYEPADGSLTNFNSRGGRRGEPFIPMTDNVQGLYVRNDTLYIGMAYGGMDMFHIPDGRLLAHYPPTGSAPDFPPSVYCFREGPDGAIYIGTMSGLYRFRPSTGKITRVREIPSVIVHTLASDSQGNLLIASQGAGVFSFDGCNWRNIRSKQIEMAMSVAATDSAVYIGTEGHGLYRYDRPSGRLIHLDAGMGTERLMVFSITGDGRLLWLTTNRGLAAYDPASGTFTRFTASDGLQSNQFKINSMLRLKDGTIIAGSVNGVNAFHPNRLTVNKTPPQAIITEITLNGDSVIALKAPSRIESLTLPADNKGFSFRFASSSYDDIAKNRFEYRLDPIDSEWHRASSANNTATYPTLAPGNYTLRLRTANGSGIFGEERTIALTAGPRKRFPYGLIWSIIAVMLCLATGATVYGVMRRRRHPAPIVITASAPVETTAEPGFISRLNEIIDAEMGNVDLSVDQLAQMTGTGRTVFYRKVKEETGLSPNEYLRVRRLDRAAELLTNTDLRISQVCYRTGFTPPSYFARCFQQRFGQTPSTYINSLRHGDRPSL